MGGRRRSRDAGRAGEDEWGDLFGEAFDVGFVLAADANAKLNLGNIRRRLAGEMSVRGVDADELRQDDVEFQAEILKPLAEDPVGGLGFFVSVGPGIDERADGFPAGGIGDRDFVKVGVRVAGDAEDLDAVFAVGGKWIEAKSATTSGVMYACGSPIS